MIPLGKLFIKLCQYELKSALHATMDYLNGLIFFVMVVCVLPFAWGTELKQLQQLMPGGIWIAVLLASLLSLSPLFQHDQVTGYLDKLRLSPQPLAWLLLAKIIAHWCLTGLPIVLIAPMLGFLFQLDGQTNLVLFMSLLLGTPILCFIGAMVAALTLGLQYRGLLLAIIVLPLFIPILIFGCTAVQSSVLNGVFPLAQITLLAAFLLFTLAIAPWATAGIVKIGMVES
jgi:heme exporter protein B